MSNRIEDQILKALLQIFARRRGEGETAIASALTEIEQDDTIDTRGKAKHELVPPDLLQLVLQPDLNEYILDLIARMLNNDPAARDELVKILSSQNTAYKLRLALTRVLAKCVEHGYSNAEEVLRAALSNTKELKLYKQLVAAIQETSEYTAEYLSVRAKRYPSPRPLPRDYPG